MLAATLLLSWVVSAFAAKEVCYSKQRYSLTMAVGDEVFALHAEEYGTLGEIALVAHPKHQRKPGTPSTFLTLSLPSTCCLLAPDNAY